MATNYEILMSLTRKQMNAFISSLVNKEVSRYIDWEAWLSSENPEPPFIGEAAFLKENDGETACYLLEENEENGYRTRKIFIPGEKGTIVNRTVEAYLVRKQSEPIYPAAPLPELSEEEMNAVLDESDFVLESLLSEAEEEARSIDDMINASIDAAFDEPQPETAEPEPAAQEAEEPEPEQPEPAEPVIEEPAFEEPEEPVIEEPAIEEPEEPEPAAGETEPEEPETAEPEPEEPMIEEAEPVEAEEPESEPVIEEPEEAEEPAAEEEKELPFSEEDDEILAVPLEDTEIPDLPEIEETPNEEDLLHRNLSELLFDDEDEISAEPAFDDLDDLDLSVLEQLENEVLAADRAEDEATSSISFDDLIAKSVDEAQQIEEEPAETEEEAEEPEEEAEEDEVVDFFEARDKEAASNPDYYSRGRIELLKESLFDDEDEPPLGTGDLVFQETTAIEIDPLRQELPEAADLDEAISFAEVQIPEEMIETAEKAESTSSLELEADEDTDEFFERVSRMNESEKDDSESGDLDLEAIKRENSLLEKSDEDEEGKESDSEITPEEAERDFRSDTLAQLLIDKKKLSMLYDPNDPEDQELPTIAFSFLNNDEEEMF